jgi:hypothetical protein
MGSREIHQCNCRECQGGNEVIRKQHENLNLLMSRLDEQQRRWMAALEANKIGHGGTKKLSAITGLDMPKQCSMGFTNWFTIRVVFMWGQGLTVKAAQLKGHYPTRVKVSDAQMATMNLTQRQICPQWNYVFHPRPQPLQNT